MVRGKPIKQNVPPVPAPGEANPPILDSVAPDAQTDVPVTSSGRGRGAIPFTEGERDVTDGPAGMSRPLDASSQPPVGRGRGRGLPASEKAKVAKGPTGSNASFKKHLSKGKGSSGAPYRVKSNHFQLHLPKGSFNVYQYDIKVEKVIPCDEEEAGYRKKQIKNKQDVSRILCRVSDQPDFQNAFESQYNFVHDNFGIGFSDKRVPCKVFDFEVALPDSVASRFQVHIAPAYPVMPIEIDPSELDLDQRLGSQSPHQVFFNLLVNQSQRQDNKRVSFGTARYFSRMPENWSDPTFVVPMVGGSLIHQSGIFSTVRPLDGQRRAVLIRLINSAFFPPVYLLKFIEETLRSKPRGQQLSQNYRQNPTPNDIRQMKSVLSRLKKHKIKVESYHRVLSDNAEVNDKRRYVYNDIVQSARQLEFRDKSEMKSVERYFAEKHEQRQFYPLQFPALPCCFVGPKERKHKIYIPMEFVQISAGQRCISLDGQETSDMIKHSLGRLPQAITQIEEIAKEATPTADDFLKAFEVRYDTRMLETEARRLSFPELEYGRNVKAPIDSKTAAWRLQDKCSFLRPCNEVKKWQIVQFGTRLDGNLVKTFSERLCSIARDRGLILQACQGMKMLPSGGDIKRMMNELKSEQCGLAIVVIPKKNCQEYGETKAKAELVSENNGLVTQCIVQKNVTHYKSDVLRNICLKLNIKLGGYNCRLARNTVQQLDILRLPILYLSADVNHQYEAPSVAAIVGSVNRYCFGKVMSGEDVVGPQHFHAVLRVQQNDRKGSAIRSQEIIRDMHGAVLEILEMFRENNEGLLPAAIVMFRDGVSNGQFLDVLQDELGQIQTACLDFGDRIGADGLKTSLDFYKRQGQRFSNYTKGRYEPPIVFTVVQKRTNERFFPSGNAQKNVRNGNILPGVVVDHNVTAPNTKGDDYNYFLHSHDVIQGVGRTPSYHTLHDDLNLSADELQKLTFYLCFLMVRCTRAVSIPAPVFYADLMAARGREYLNNILHMNSDASTSAGSFGNQITEAQLRDYESQLRLHADLVNKGMIFI